MSSLQARLDRMREGFVAKAPPEALAIMNRSTRDLEDAARSATGEGGTMPPFQLANHLGDVVDLNHLVARGPLVVTFFRGHW